MRLLSMVVSLGLCSTVGSVAHAAPGIELPEVSLASPPYLSFSGELCETATELLTVPAGREFLVTMVVTTTDGNTSQDGDWDAYYGSMLMRDGAPALAGRSIGNKSTIPVANGTGRLPVGSGSTLSIKSVATGASCREFYLQGYYIEAGSPYRSFYGNSGLGRDVLTVETGKRFLVRTIALSSRSSPGYCHVLVDGVRTINGDTWATTDRNHWGSGRPGGFANGKGTLLLTEGQTLEVGPDDSTVESQCDYYVAGEYITP